MRELPRGSERETLRELEKEKRYRHLVLLHFGRFPELGPGPTSDQEELRLRAHEDPCLPGCPALIIVQGGEN